MQNQRDLEIVKKICSYCAKRLSDEFVNAHNEIPWREIKAMRNIYAHEYDSIAPQIVWDTIIYDCPELNKYCSQILKD